MFAGQMGCEALNWILKRLIKEERPRRTSSNAVDDSKSTGDRLTSRHAYSLSSGLHGKGYGMPSSHAQFVTFFAVSVTLFLMVRHNPHTANTSTTHIPTSFLERLALSGLVTAGAVAVAQSRIYLNYHTPKQVYVGVAAGAACALAWFVFTSLLRHYGWIEWGLDTKIAHYFRMRDLVVNEDLVDAGWERWQTRKRRRAEGLESKKSR